MRSSAALRRSRHGHPLKVVSQTAQGFCDQDEVCTESLCRTGVQGILSLGSENLVGMKDHSPGTQISMRNCASILPVLYSVCKEMRMNRWIHVPHPRRRVIRRLQGPGVHGEFEHRSFWTGLAKVVCNREV